MEKEDQFLSYSGNDPLIKSTISMLRDLDRKQPFLNQYKGNPRWDAALLTRQLRKDSSYVLVLPLVDKEKTLTDFIKIKASPGKIVEKPILYSYEND